MEISILTIFVVLALFYLFKPITRLEEQNFKSKNNWRGGF